MVQTLVVIGYVFNLLPFAALTYLLATLSLDKSHHMLSAISASFINRQKNKMIRYLLVFVAIALTFKLAGLLMYLLGIRVANLTEVMQIASDALMLLAVLYLIFSNNFLGVIRKTIRK